MSLEKESGPLEPDPGNAGVGIAFNALAEIPLAMTLAIAGHRLQKRNFHESQGIYFN